VASEHDHDRTEEPTQKRREDARRRGQVASSTDLTAAMVLVGALGVHVMVGGRFLVDAVEAVQQRLGAVPRGDLTTDGALTLLADAAGVIVRLGWPFLAIPVAIAVAAQLLQTRFVLAPEALRAHWERLSPRQNLARLLGLRGAVETVKALGKLAIVGGVASLTLRAEWPSLLEVSAGGGSASLAPLTRVAVTLWLRIGAAYLALAALDYGWQWWQHERSLKMTKDELRRETKESEGDPTLRQKIRQLQRKMSRRRLVAEVERADVVLRNPTHFAVALRYESGAMRAPRVVAKGERLLAARIIEIARQFGVPVVENPPLTRALFKAVPVGGEVPFDLYRAVADVLAYVYSLRGARR
jgi:flagellar biosynthetic protein FlhB